jgi:hypothetical protein
MKQGEYARIHPGSEADSEQDIVKKDIRAAGMLSSLKGGELTISN